MHARQDDLKHKGEVEKLNWRIILGSQLAIVINFVKICVEKHKMMQYEKRRSWEVILDNNFRFTVSS